MNSNTRHLVGLWAGAVLIMVWVAFDLGSALLQGQTWEVGLSIAFTAVIVMVIKWRGGDRQIRRLLQSDSPEDLVPFYKRTIRTGLVPDGDALLAQACAVAYTLYADYPAARAALQSVNWDHRPPLIRSSGQSVEALLCYFETRQYKQGLELARSAQKAGGVSGLFPGARASAAAFESLVEIGEVLSGCSTGSTVGSLERKMKVLPTLGRLLVAWGLANAYRKNGDDAKAETMLAYIREIAPHCRALSLPSHAEPA